MRQQSIRPFFTTRTAGTFSVTPASQKTLPEGSRPKPLLYMQETIPLIKNYLMNGSCIGAIVRPDHYVYCGVTDTQNTLDAMASLAAKLRFQD